MPETTPTKRASRLRLQAARMQERALPDLVRSAYGELPAGARGRGGEQPTQDGGREAARAALIERGHLTAEELETLAVEEAVAVARQRMREQIAALQEESTRLDNRERGQREAVVRPPRSLRG